MSEFLQNGEYDKLTKLIQNLDILETKTNEKKRLMVGDIIDWNGPVYAG